MRYIIAEEDGLTGIIDKNRMEFMEAVFGAKESLYKHKHVIDCAIDAEKEIMFIVGHNYSVYKFLTNCIRQDLYMRYFTSADLIILITCEFGSLHLNDKWSGILQGKLSRLKSDLLDRFTRIDDYGLPFKLTAYEAELWRKKQVLTFEKFWGITDKYLVKM